MKNKSPLVINLMGGPGAGKSTGSTRLFSELKELGYNAEYVPEYAKDLVWGRNMKTLDNQIYVFAKQHHRIWRLLDQVDVIVTDSPIFLSCIYGKTSNTFKSLVIEEFNKLNSLNILLKRVKPYNPSGRYQNEHEAKELDIVIENFLIDNKISYNIVNGNKEGVDEIVKIVNKLFTKTDA
jgi:hypothetical protein